MANVTFEDYSIKCKEAISQNVEAALEEAAGELESAVKRNTRVDTGQLKNSWRHTVASDGEQHEAVIGSELENAIWEELGTGEHALNGDGRKGGWYYVDAKGDGHFTRGKKPSRAFYKAFTALKAKLIQIIQEKLKGL
jgi:phosphotransferase system IIB component